MLELLKKEWTLEWRQKSSFMAVLLYVVSTNFICYLSFKKVVDIPTWNALLWIIILFANINLISGSFRHENEGRFLYLYSLASPHQIIGAKLIYYGLLSVVLSIVSFFMFALFTGNPSQDGLMFLLVLILGSMGIALLLTFISAISSKTKNLSLLAVLGLPVLMPLLLTIIRASKNAIDGLGWGVNIKFVAVILCLNLITVAMSYILFPYLWSD